jgi:hypothetical protein|tara:strand:- start:10995 stop:11369 length:375 start_codon:yes stop_codon:yes gene_type:complete
MDRISGSIPFPTNAFPVNRAAQAYGVRPVAKVAPVSDSSQTTRTDVPSRTEPIARIGRSQQSRPATDPSRLVAAQVDAIDLANDVAAVQGRPTPGGAFPMYRHPADRNQAATGIALGRSLDVQG